MRHRYVIVTIPFSRTSEFLADRPLGRTLRASVVQNPACCCLAKGEPRIYGMPFSGPLRHLHNSASPLACLRTN